MLMQQNKKAIDVSEREFNGAVTYRKDLYYINTIIGNGKRKEMVVSKWSFYTTWLNWVLIRRSYRKLRGFNVLRQE